MVGGVGARVRSTLMAIGVVLCDDRDRRSFFSQASECNAQSWVKQSGGARAGLAGPVLANHNAGNSSEPQAGPEDEGDPSCRQL